MQTIAFLGLEVVSWSVPFADGDRYTSSDSRTLARGRVQEGRGIHHDHRLHLRSHQMEQSIRTVATVWCYRS